MVKPLVAAYAPADVRQHVLAKFDSGEWEGKTAQLLTERTGGSDLGPLETTATRRGDGCTWLLNGFKWFVSNCDGEAFVVLAKPEGAPDSGRGTATFLVLRTRRDGSPTACASVGPRTSWAPARWPPVRWNSSTPTPSCCPVSRAPRQARPTAEGWAG